MIDIRNIVAEIVKAKDASDAKAYTVHAHNLVRAYGQALLLNLQQAIAPSSPEEESVVRWLHGRLVKIASQIPEPIPSKEK